MVTGQAEPVIILNDKNTSDQEDRFTLHWVVSSRSQVDRWVVGLRRAGDSDADWQYLQVETDVSNDTADNMTNDDQYQGELELTGLSAGTEYQVTVATSNGFGLGQHGDIYTFSTKQSGELHFKRNYSFMIKL